VVKVAGGEYDRNDSWSGFTRIFGNPALCHAFLLDNDTLGYTALLHETKQNTHTIPQIGPDFSGSFFYDENKYADLETILQGVMMNDYETHKLDTYLIRVRETLDTHFADWLGDFSLVPQQNGETLLVGTFPDQPALRGFLEQLWNLNITIISVLRAEKNEK
jgi:hypothetical protein